MNPLHPLSDTQRMPTPIQARALLAQCRDVARGRLRRVAADALQRMEADLFALAEGSKSREQQNVLFDVIGKVRDHREEIARSFDKKVAQVFDERLLGEPEKKPEIQAFAENMRLVDDGLIMETIVVSDLVKRTKHKIDPEQLLGVRARIGYLLGVEMLEDERNPLGAEAVIEALDRTCAEYASEGSAKRALLTVFQPYIASGMTDVYAEVNAMLVARNVLPRIRHAIRRTPDASSLPGLGAAEALARTGAHQLNQLLSTTQPMMSGAAHLGQPTMPPLSATQPMRLSNMMSATQPFGVPATGTGAHSSAPVGLSAEATAALAQIVVGPVEARRQVVRMLAEPSRHAFDAALATPATPELVESLTSLQSQLEVTSGLTQTWLRALDQDVRTQSHPLDQLTIDFVAAVFDIIFHDNSISDAVKSEIARLQIVAVKSAIIDRSFFARRQHPMRQFLDRIAESAGDPNLDTGQGSPFVKGLRGIVDALNANFVEDLSQISISLERLEALIVAHSAAEEEKARVNTAEIELAERREIALSMAKLEFKRRVPENTPAFLREFLESHWSEAVVDAYVHDRQGEDAWARRLALVDTLVWSVGPLRSNAVAKLATLLPKLMQDLSRGMAAAQVPQERRKTFFDSLMSAHTRVVNEAKASSRAHALASGEPDPTPSMPPLRPLPPLAADSLDFTTVGPEMSNFHEHFINAMEKGALVEFIASDPAGNQIWQRLKLAWISPKRMVFLFTARLTKARQMQRAALLEALQTGTARVVDSSERYMDQAIQAIAVQPS